MDNQQKQLQSILSEAGINLTDNQILAVIDAVSLSCKSPIPYHEVMEFKEKYAPKREKQDGFIIREHDNTPIGLKKGVDGFVICEKI